MGKNHTPLAVGDPISQEGAANSRVSLLAITTPQEDLAPLDPQVRMAGLMTSSQLHTSQTLLGKPLLGEPFSGLPPIPTSLNPSTPIQTPVKNEISTGTSSHPLDALEEPSPICEGFEDQYHSSAGQTDLPTWNMPPVRLPLLPEERELGEDTPIENFQSDLGMDHRGQSSPVTPYESDSQGPEELQTARQKISSHDEMALFTGVRTGAKTHQFAIAKIQHGYQLADRHAYYAARQEFVQVLRIVSRTLSAKEGTVTRTTQLANGLRALEEAKDFAPRGTGLEAELNVSIITSAHRTPVAETIQVQKLLPQQLMDRYLRYAQLQLAAAVDGDPDGSMALYALGKLQRRLIQMEPKSHPLAHRQAFAFQQAALLAHEYNHLAAHELGVLLADAGHYPEAENLLTQVATKEPHPVVLRNLAQVQYKLGEAGRAARNDRRANQLASRSSVVGSSVQWVSPHEFARATDTTTFDRPTQSLARKPSMRSHSTDSNPATRLEQRNNASRPAPEPPRNPPSATKPHAPQNLPSHNARASSSPSYPQGMR